MSGGGRCNFTNTGCTSANFLSANPHFCKSALARYTPADFIAQVEAYGIAYHEKEKLQLFCNHSSKQIVRMLLDECAAAGVHIETDITVERVSRTGDGFCVYTSEESLHSESVVIATGGLSIPRMGASGFGYRVARAFGLPVRATRAALVPFTVNGARRESFAALSGIGADVEATCNNGVFDAGLLFTHRGLSGPAMLQTSSYWQDGDAVHIDWFAGDDVHAWLKDRQNARPDARLANVLAERFPKRLAQWLVERIDGRDARLKQYAAQQLAQLAARLSDWRFMPDATEGYRTAEVTLGGVDTDALSSSTLEARNVPGLYFIGEVVDVTGHLGGHNFQWAWASAQAAGAVV